MDDSSLFYSRHKLCVKCVILELQTRGRVSELMQCYPTLSNVIKPTKDICTPYPYNHIHHICVEDYIDSREALWRMLKKKNGDSKKDIFTRVSDQYPNQT